MVKSKQVQIPAPLWADICKYFLLDEDAEQDARAARIRAGVLAKMERMQAHDDFSRRAPKCLIDN